MFPEFQEKNQIKVAHIVLHTKIAFKLMKGKGIGPVGILKFAGLISRIWHAAGQDDPYADLFLLRIYDSVKQMRRELHNLEKGYKNYLAQESGIELDILTNQTPVRVPLKFDNPYAYMTAYLLADFDRLARLLISLRHYGLSPDKVVLEEQRSIMRKIRQTLSEPLRWKNTGVTREDIRLNTAKAKLAFDKMGKLHEAVLTERIRPPLNPRPALQSSASATVRIGSKATAIPVTGTKSSN